MVIDGESGDELEDLTDIVGRWEGKSPKRAKGRKSKKKNRAMPEVAVGSDAGDAEELSHHHDVYAEHDDDYAGFDDDSGYEPSWVQTPKKVSMT